jgi:hypothetical protein
LRLLPQVSLRVDDVAGDRQVGIDRLAGKQQMHDLGGALEDPVDSQVAQDLLGRYPALAAGG